jgi:hypothetical protein
MPINHPRAMMPHIALSLISIRITIFLFLHVIIANQSPVAFQVCSVRGMGCGGHLVICALALSLWHAICRSRCNGRHTTSVEDPAHSGLSEWGRDPLAFEVGPSGHAGA